MSDLTVNILVGALFCVLGAALSRIEDIVQALKLYRRQKSYLCREWHTYHYTRDSEGVPFIRYELWDITRTRTGLYQVATSDPDRPELVYKGLLRSEGQNLLIDMRQDLEETVNVRIQKPYGDMKERLYGLWQGIDFGGREYCSVVIMSSHKFDDVSAAAEKLTKHADLTTIPTGIALIWR